MKLHFDKEWTKEAIENEPDDVSCEAGFCLYCKGEPEPGYIEMPNNGPTVTCPMCNSDGSRPRKT